VSHEFFKPRFVIRGGKVAVDFAGKSADFGVAEQAGSTCQTVHHES
jgi:hypothetical protein